jgi:hypothetical protein
MRGSASSSDILATIRPRKLAVQNILPIRDGEPGVMSQRKK